MNFFPKDDAFLASRNLTWLALGLCLVGLLAPLMQSTSPFGVNTIGKAGFSQGFLFGVGTLALLGAYGAGVWTTYGDRLDLQRKLADGALYTSVFLFFLQCYYMAVWADWDISILIPVYLKSSGHGLGWGWVPLAVAAVALRLAADWGEREEAQTLDSGAASAARELPKWAEAAPPADDQLFQSLKVVAVGALLLQGLATYLPLISAVVSDGSPHFFPLGPRHHGAFMPPKLLLLALAAGCACSIFTGRLQLAWRLAAVSPLVAVALAGYQVLYSTRTDILPPFSWLSSARIIPSWGWVPLAAAQLLLVWLALGARNQEADSQTASAATGPVPLQRKESEVVTTGRGATDTGRCTSCQTLNSRHASRCHACGAMLPWMEVVPPKPTRVKGPNQQLPKLDGEFGEKALVACGHLLTFWFCTSAPLLGYFLWRYMSNEESRYAPTALWGWILGVILTVLVLLGRVAQVAT